MENDKKEEAFSFSELSGSVKELISKNKFEEGKRLTAEAMGQHPNSPEPHNLMGIILENEDQHSLAMKHFRAAWALDPTYLPARCNMEQYSNLFSPVHKDYYCEDDCVCFEDSETYKTEYDSSGNPHQLKRTRSCGLRI